MHKLIYATLLAIALSTTPVLAIDPAKPMQPQTATPPASPKVKQDTVTLFKGVYFIGNTDDFAVFADTANISKPTPETRLIWVDNVRKDEASSGRAKKKKYSRELWRVACPAKKIGLVQATDYSRDGDVIGSDAVDSQLSYAIPNSIGAAHVDFACDPAREVRSKNASRIPSGVTPVDYTDYVIFYEDQPKNCVTSAKMLTALGARDAGDKAMASCLSQPDKNARSQEDPKGLY